MSKGLFRIEADFLIFIFQIIHLNTLILQAQIYMNLLSRLSEIQGIAKFQIYWSWYSYFQKKVGEGFLLFVAYQDQNADQTAMPSLIFHCVFSCCFSPLNWFNFFQRQKICTEIGAWFFEFYSRSNVSYVQFLL